MLLAAMHLMNTAIVPEYHLCVASGDLERNEGSLHKYLRAIGFSHIESTRILEKILHDVENNFEQKKIVEKENQHSFVELSRDYGYDCGITVCGEYDEEGKFHREYYYPYYRGQNGFACTDLVVERHTDKESFAGAYDDFNLGITLIFYLINPTRYLDQLKNSKDYRLERILSFSALSDAGEVLLPIVKKQREQGNTIYNPENRSSLIAAAQKGDQEAIESLTMEDVDLYARLSKRIQNEDLYSIVNTTFMPSGIECDQYLIIGEIEDVNITKNSLTDERLYQLRIVANDVSVDVCISKMDLIGIPEPGRRFKGKIWLQGMIE